LAKVMLPWVLVRKIRSFGLQPQSGSGLRWRAGLRRRHGVSGHLGLAQHLFQHGGQQIQKIPGVVFDDVLDAPSLRASTATCSLPPPVIITAGGLSPSSARAAAIQTGFVGQDVVGSKNLKTAFGPALQSLLRR
jgi:hypothetical protein